MADFTQLETLVNAIVAAEKQVETTTTADDAAQSALESASSTAQKTAQAKGDANTAMKKAAADLDNFLNPPAAAPAS